MSEEARGTWTWVSAGFDHLGIARAPARVPRQPSPGTQSPWPPFSWQEKGGTGSGWKSSLISLDHPFYRTSHKTERNESTTDA